MIWTASPLRAVSLYLVFMTASPRSRACGRKGLQLSAGLGPPGHMAALTGKALSPPSSPFQIHIDCTQGMHLVYASRNNLKIISNQPFCLTSRYPRNQIAGLPQRNSQAID